MTKIENFEKTLKTLKSFLAEPIVTDRDRAGIIQAFEFTFEQSWKAIQKMAYTRGVELASPKSAFTFAMQNHWLEIKDEPQYLQMLVDRNLTSHTYQENLAKEVIDRIRKHYIFLFEKLFATLSKYAET